MVPRHPFPPGAERAAMRCFMPDAAGFADTGYPCRADRDSGELSITGPPPGIVSVGGYRFKLEQLQELVGRTDPDAILAALPDALAGHRLAGSATGARPAPANARRAWRQSAGQRARSPSAAECCTADHSR